MAVLEVGVNDLATLRPDLLKDWDWHNNYKRPEELMLGSNYRAKWVCHVCGYKWESRLDSRTKNMHGCPMCARGKGSSVADYTLFKLVDMSLDCEVLYRYNILSGCEADVYIPSKNIVIEYDGYGFHKFQGKQVKDSEKEGRFLDNGLEVFRIIERSDRVKEKVIDGNKAYIPEISLDSYDYLKDVLSEIMSYWGIIEYSSIPNDFFELKLEDVKIITRKPSYSRSLACALSDRDDIEWDYDKNGTLKPEDIFRSVKFPKVWVRCKNGHSYETTPRGINDGFGCRVCLGRENSNLKNIDITYNMSLLFKDLPSMHGFYINERKHCSFVCPFCGEDHSYRLSYIVAKSNKHILDYCDCTRVINSSELTILGKDINNRVYYCLNVNERYFLGICNNIQSDILLSRLNVDINCVKDLDVSMFRKYLGDPFVMLTSLNSQNTIPVNKRKIGVKLSGGNIEDCYKALYNQKVNGIKFEIIDGFAIPVVKKVVVDYFKRRFESEYGYIFATNRTVGEVVTSLACGKLGVYIVIKIGSCKTDDVDRAISFLTDYKGVKMFFLTSYRDCVNEDNGVFYIPDTVFDNRYEKMLSNLYDKFKSFYDLN